jgi:hypothetical protein
MPRIAGSAGVLGWCVRPVHVVSAGGWKRCGSVCGHNDAASASSRCFRPSPPAAAGGRGASILPATRRCSGFMANRTRPSQGNRGQAHTAPTKAPRRHHRRPPARRPHANSGPRRRRSRERFRGNADGPYVAFPILRPRGILRLKAIVSGNAPSSLAGTIVGGGACSS